MEQGPILLDIEIGFVNKGFYEIISIFQVN